MGSTKETTPFIHWKASVVALAGVTVTIADKQRARIALWFNAGESAECAAEMLKAFSEPHIQQVRPSRIARRWFRDGVRVL